MEVGKLNCVLDLDPKQYSRSKIIKQLQQLATKYKGASDQQIIDSGVFRTVFASPLQPDSKLHHHFSLFVDQDLETSNALIQTFYKFNDLDQLLQTAISKLVTPLHPLLVKYSLAVAINHSRQFKQLKPQIAQGFVIAPNHVFVDRCIPKRWINPDNLLKWWREDPLLNSHHWNWHCAYPSFGVLDDKPQPTLKDRQGELFVFMHRQMVARYDCERTALGIYPVEEYGMNGYREPLGDTFDPLVSLFSARPADSVMKDKVSGTAPPFDSITTMDLEVWRDRILEAIQNRSFKKTIVASDGSIMTSQVPMTINDLGACLEATIGNPNRAYYGNLNKQAHNLISRVGVPNGEPLTDNVGIMADIIGAFRDPIFWRWHKHLDEFFHRFEITQSSYKLEEAAPEKFKVLTTKIRQLYTPTHIINPVTGLPDVQLTPSKSPGDNLLTTYMKTQNISIKFDGTVVDYVPGTKDNEDIINSYETYRLYYVPFNYEITVANDDATFKKVVVRVYIVANDDYGDRRKWIALDQFYTSLPAGEKTYTISRTSSESTILQQADTEDWPSNWEALNKDQPSKTSPTYCRCGLPRNLLLPRGSKDGMKFKLCVVVTDAKYDLIVYQDGTSSCCDGNIYCGTYNKPYPFRMEMGYPFNRPIPNVQGVYSPQEKMDAYLHQPNIWKGDVVIRWDTPKPAAA